jgi:hypothetical protein
MPPVTNFKSAKWKKSIHGSNLGHKGGLAPLNNFSQGGAKKVRPLPVKLTVNISPDHLQFNYSQLNHTSKKPV